MGWSEFKIYTDKLAELSSIFDELIYLSNKFDIKRLNNFLINIIENHDFYILEDENNEYSDGYSDLEDEYKLSRDILETDEYINMMEYINENFSKMYEQYLLFINKIDSLTSIYLEDLRLVNVDIIKNFSSEYDAVIFNLELLQQKLSYIPNKDKIEENKDNVEKNKDNVEKKINLNIDVLLITNNSIMYGIGYKFYKKYLYKNLHVIRKDTYDITYSDEKEFDIKFNNIYLNIYNEFINTLINGKAKNFDEKFLIDLKEKIRKYKEKSKEEGNKASQAIDGINKLAKEEENKDKLNKKKLSEDKEKRKEEADQNDDNIEEEVRKKQEEEQIKAMKNRDNIKEGIEKLTKSKKKEEEKKEEPKEKEEEKEKPKKTDANEDEDEEEEEEEEEVEVEVEVKKPEIVEPPNDNNTKTLTIRLDMFNKDINPNKKLNLEEYEELYKKYQAWFEEKFPDIKDKIPNVPPLTPSSIQTTTNPMLPGPPLLGSPLLGSPRPGPPYSGHMLQGPSQQGPPLLGSPLLGSPRPGPPYSGHMLQGPSQQGPPLLGSPRPGPPYSGHMLPVSPYPGSMLQGPSQQGPMLQGHMQPVYQQDPRLPGPMRQPQFQQQQQGPPLIYQDHRLQASPQQGPMRQPQLQQQYQQQQQQRFQQLPEYTPDLHGKMLNGPHGRTAVYVG